MFWVFSFFFEKPVCLSMSKSGQTLRTWDVIYVAHGSKGLSCVMRFGAGKKSHFCIRAGRRCIRKHPTNPPATKDAPPTVYCPCLALYVLILCAGEVFGVGGWERVPDRTFAFWVTEKQGCGSLLLVWGGQEGQPRFPTKARSLANSPMSS